MEVVVCGVQFLVPTTAPAATDGATNFTANLSGWCFFFVLFFFFLSFASPVSFFPPSRRAIARYLIPLGLPPRA